jgi:hypothetical protein
MLRTEIVMRALKKFFQYFQERALFMSKGTALFFAITGAIFLAGIGFAISLRSPWLVLLFSIVSVLFIGFGFVTKAKLGKRRN